MDKAFICLFIVMACCSMTATSNIACLPHERDALLAMKNESYSPAGPLHSWKGFNCCEWRGVQCSQYTSHVIKLNFAKFFLWGNGTRIVQFFLKLKFLEHLDLSYNYFDGSLPRELFGLRKLRHLDLSWNMFVGEIPKEVGSLNSLTYLNLSFAGLEGRIPWQLGNLSQLQFLDLSEHASDVYDSGKMYSSSLWWIEKLRELKYLRLPGVVLNMTSEDLEASLSHLHNLHLFDLSYCSLSGHIPSVIQNFTSLSHLHLDGNNFYSSTVPSWLENITSLVSLRLDGSYLSGSFPLGVSSLPLLKELSLSDNPLPANISQILCGEWPYLTTFSLSGSNVIGIIPPSIGNLSSLQELDLRNNSLSGEIPPSLGQLSILRNLDLSYNQLNGSIPLKLGGPSSLRNLDISNNQLSGSIPLTLGGLSFLIGLDLSNNQLNGTIPTSIGLLPCLEWMDLSSNNLQGNFALHAFQRSKNLADLTLSYNQLTVQVDPKWIPPFYLESLKLASCNIEGLLPPFLSTQYTLYNLDLSMNSLSGTFHLG